MLIYVTLLIKRSSIWGRVAGIIGGIRGKRNWESLERGQGSYVVMFKL